jgi:hypothetical protein
MEGPTEEAEALIPIVERVVSSGPNLVRTSGTSMLRRKAAKRSETWYLASPPQEDYILATKRPRLEIPIATATAEAATEAASRPDVAMALPPPADDADDADADANADSVTETQWNPRATGATARWTSEEDAELTSVVVANTCNTKGGKKYTKDRAAVAALVLGRTKTQCSDRWQHALKHSITQSAGRVGKWAAVEDSRLKDAVQMHGGKNWDKIAALVLSRTQKQCYDRWNRVLIANSDQVTERTGTWTEDEDMKLKDAVQTHGGKNWGAIATLVPGPKKVHCYHRWHYVLDPSIDRVNERTGQWTEVEDSKLKDAVQTHGGKNWDGISALVPGRTQKGYTNRWHRFWDRESTFPYQKSKNSVLQKISIAKQNGALFKIRRQHH